MTRYLLPTKQIVQDDQPFALMRAVTVPDQGMTDDETGDFVVVVPEYEQDQEIQYPGGVRGLTADERAALGITEIVEEARPDDRFFFVNEDPEQPGAWVATPRPLADLKSALVAQSKATAAAILSATDWQVIRQIEGTPMDVGIAAFRESIRNHSNELETSINGATTIDDLQGIDLAGWPQQAA